MVQKLTNLKHLHYLVTLYDKQHFGRAAQACYVSQSTLSAAIANLEETLGTQLLERDHKTFLFTPLGAEIVKRSRLILEQSKELEDYATNQGQLLRGTVYLGIIPTIAPFIVNELHSLSQTLYPELNLYIREDTTENIVHYLNEGKLDLILLALPYPVGDLHTRVLTNDPFQLVLASQWANKGFEKKLDTLPKHSVFLLEKEHCLTDHALHACELKDSKKINPFFATSLHTLIQMVNHQSGITFLPELAIKSGILSDTQLVCLPLHNKKAYREIGIAWRPTSFKNELYYKLGELIKQTLVEKIEG